MDPNVSVALIGAASAFVTLLVGEIARRWKSRRDRLKEEAEEKRLIAEGDAAVTTALTDAFKAISERQAEDIADLRDRLRRVEDALLLAQQRNDTLALENRRLHEDGERLRREVERLKRRCEQLEGELRLQKQVAESASRVYGQDELEEPPHGQPEA